MEYWGTVFLTLAFEFAILDVLVTKAKEQETKPVNKEPGDGKKTDAAASGGYGVEYKTEEKGNADADGNPGALTDDKMDTDSAWPDKKDTGTEKAQNVPPVVTKKRMVKMNETRELKVAMCPDSGCWMKPELVMSATEKESIIRAHELYMKERSEAMNGGINPRGCQCVTAAVFLIALVIDQCWVEVVLCNIVLVSCRDDLLAATSTSIPPIV